MSGFSSWVLSIAGVSVLSVIVDIIVPSGKMQKYIKSIFSLIIVLVLVMPLPKLLNKSINISEIIEDNSFKLQENFLYQVNLDKIEALESEICDELKDNQILNTKVTISADVFSAILSIEGVFVDISEMVILEKDENININDIIKKIVQSKIQIDAGSVIISE